MCNCNEQEHDKFKMLGGDERRNGSENEPMEVTMKDRTR